MLLTLETFADRQYKVANGTHYHLDTPDELVAILENARLNGTRLRLHYGDTATGQDWGDIHDVLGTLGRSCGPVKAPILLANSRSSGGGAILDHCIVKLSAKRDTLYQLPNYRPASND
jgi:hypothetical protein